MKVISIVGMTGAGKSEAARLFEGDGFIRIRFGDVTDEEIRKRDLEPGEESERYIRELLRKEYGMAAYAILNLSKIDLARTQTHVVIDGLYSWDEYTFLKTYYKEDFYIVAVWASPRTRYARLSGRLSRGLTPEQAANRDKAELENISKAGPIVMADFIIVNESSLKNLKKEVKGVISKLRWKD